MEMAVQMEDLNVRLDVNWTPRDYNEEADRLSNGNSEGFTLDK